MSRNMNTNMKNNNSMNAWFVYAIGAAVLYGLHQIFTKLAADRIGDGLGGFVVEATAALTILTYLIYLRVAGNWNQSVSAPGRLVFRPHRHLCLVCFISAPLPAWPPAPTQMPVRTEYQTPGALAV